MIESGSIEVHNVDVGYEFLFRNTPEVVNEINGAGPFLFLARQLRAYEELLFFDLVGSDWKS